MRFNEFLFYGGISFLILLFSGFITITTNSSDSLLQHANKTTVDIEYEYKYIDYDTSKICELELRIRNVDKIYFNKTQAEEIKKELNIELHNEIFLYKYYTNKTIARCD